MDFSIGWNSFSFETLCEGNKTIVLKVAGGR